MQHGETGHPVISEIFIGCSKLYRSRLIDDMQSKDMLGLDTHQRSFLCITAEYCSDPACQNSIHCTVTCPPFELGQARIHFHSNSDVAMNRIFPII